MIIMFIFNIFIMFSSSKPTAVLLEHSFRHPFHGQVPPYNLPPALWTVSHLRVVPAVLAENMAISTLPYMGWRAHHLSTNWTLKLSSCFCYVVFSGFSKVFSWAGVAMLPSLT